MSTISTLIATTRPSFLVLTPATLSLAYAISYWQQATIDLWLACLVLIAALSAHISVNTFNEYADFSSGLDLKTNRTPFSGGSGALPEDPSSLMKVKLLAWSTLGITSLIGLYFIYLRGWLLLPIGLAGIVLITTYTTRLTKNSWLCLIAPGLAFGPIFIIGSNLVLTGEYSASAAAASVPLFFLTNNLLLLNQFPDIAADRQAGRNHLIIQKGNQVAAQIFVLFNLLAFICLGLAVTLSLLPPWALIGLLPTILAIPTSINTLANVENIENLLSSMKKNVAVNILTPILMAIGILL